MLLIHSMYGAECMRRVCVIGSLFIIGTFIYLCYPLILYGGLARALALYFSRFAPCTRRCRSINKYTRRTLRNSICIYICIYVYPRDCCERNEPLRRVTTCSQTLEEICFINFVICGSISLYTINILL